MCLGESASLTFQLWRSNHSPNAALHLASFVNGEAKNIARHSAVRGPFWGDVAISIREDVAARLASDDNKKFLRAAANMVSDEDRFYLVDAALANLETQF